MEIVLICLVALVSLVMGIRLFLAQNDNEISKAMWQTGLSLVGIQWCSWEGIVLLLIKQFFNVEVPENSDSNVLLITGIILIFLGVIVHIKLRERLYVLNMLGIQKKEINNEQAKKELNIADYQLKEQVLDIMPVFEDGTRVDKRSNSYITEQIREDVKKFAVKSKEFGGAFTGMAPIPYTIFAGTFLGEADVNRYFEFNRNDGEKYYELKKSKLEYFKGIFQKRQLKPWDALEYTIQEKDESVKEIILSISITHNIEDSDLKQFQGLKVVRMKVPTPKDNLIEFYEQLNEYKKTIHECLDVKLREWFPNLEKVHLVASVPSCVSIEIGKIIGMGRNRVMDIIVYHYIYSSSNRYPFGIYVSGNKKGTLVKCN